MLLDWLRFGYAHEAFWDQTMRSLMLTFRAQADMADERHNERAWLAWNIAALSRAKRLPDLKRLLATKRVPKPRQTWQQQFAIMERWVAVSRRSPMRRLGEETSCPEK